MAPAARDAAFAAAQRRRVAARREACERKLEAAEREGRQLRVKLGLDPTAPDIHLGHTVVLQKLREFQDLGHRVVLIVGDYTARVGDPERPLDDAPGAVGRGDRRQRPRPTRSRPSTVLLDDPELLEVRLNGEWLDMRMEELFRLARTATVAQLLERDDFAKRFAAQAPISVLELLYPLLQGYDSVAIAADVELGGTDQTFNLLLGARRPARLRPARAGDPDDADPARDRRRREDVEVAGQPHRRHRGARRDVRARRCRCPTRRWTRGSRCWPSSARRRAPAPRDAKRALARALVDALPRRRGRGGGRGSTSTASFVQPRGARRDRGARGRGRERRGAPAGG